MSLSNKLSITDVDVKGKRVLIRVSSYLPLHRWTFPAKLGKLMTSLSIVTSASIRIVPGFPGIASNY